MRHYRPHVLLLVLIATVAIAPGAKSTQAQSALLTVQPATGEPLELTLEQWNALPHATVTTVEHGGERATFEGVPVAEVLRLAAAPLGPDLRGESLHYYVVAHAADGYEVVFALAEFDPAFSERVILIADRRNGERLGASEGPLRFVVPGDKRQARWIRKLQAITIHTAH